MPTHTNNEHQPQSTDIITGTAAAVPGQCGAGSTLGVSNYNRATAGGGLWPGINSPVLP